MAIIVPIFLYFLIAISIVQNHFLLAGTLILIFSYKYSAAVLIPLAIVIDGYFGNFYTIPWLSFFSIVYYLLVDFLRPRIKKV